MLGKLFCVLHALALVALPSPLLAQRFAQRGFLESRGTFYPQTAPNDAVQALGELHFRYETFFRVTD